jgi:deoxyribonuclease-1-like protein
MPRQRIIIAIIAAAVIMVVIGCAAHQAMTPQAPLRPATVVPPTIRIATFNIQIFGQAKMAKPQVMGYIVDIVDDYDIVAIQEIRSLEQNVIPTLVAMLGPEHWDFRISARLGRTVSKEQYAYVYRRDRVTMGPCWIVDDPGDRLHREPFACEATAGRFDFLLLNIHTDPDEVETEINALDDVLVAALAIEGDAILLGDLNASPSEFDELGELPGITWIVPDGIPTNTRGTKTYDNLVFIGSEVREFTGQGGVLDFPAVFGIDLEQALAISDHLPVWAEFSTTADLD